MKIVGFVGPKGSGKDTAALILIEGKKAQGKLSFAGPLKEICGKVFGLSFNQLNDPELKEQPLYAPITLAPKHFREINRLLDVYLPPVTSDGRVLYRLGVASIVGLEGRVIATPRELLQIIGTNYIRDRVYKNWHLLAALGPTALKGKDQDGLYCVTDVRFVNEFEHLRDTFGNDFICYYVERPEAEERLAAATHPSETDVIKVKAQLPETQVLKNTGTLEDLKALVKALPLPTDAESEGKAAKKGKARTGRFKYAATGK